MNVEIKVPPLGESITEATIGVLLKEDGAYVRENNELCELETEKVNQVLYASTKGKLSWKVKPGDQVQIDTVIGVIEESEKVPEVKVEAEKPKAEPPKVEKKSEPLPLREEKPQVEKRAEAVKESQVARAPSKWGKEVREPMTPIRKTIARKLVEGMQSAAILTTFNEIDMSQVMEMRSRFKERFLEKHQLKLGLTSFFVKAVVEALKAQPKLNSYIDGEDIVRREYYHIGIAVGATRGLVVPVLRNVDQMSFVEIERNIADVATRAKTGRLSLEELEGAGFTITNGGVFGSLLSTPLLPTKQSGILGMHTIQKRPVAIQDNVVIRPMMYVALSYDHRLIDGQDAILFLVKLKEILEDPARLIVFEE